MNIPLKINKYSLNTIGETYFLNIRFLLIVCVVAGNLLEPLIQQSIAAHHLFVWIFSFHMPLFVLVTGYFARFNLHGPAGSQMLRHIALQYILFQSIYSVLDYTIFRVPHITHSFFAPYLLLWFLAGHIVWRLLLISLRMFTFKQQLIVSLALGLGVGLLPVDGVWLALSRTLIYFPFFIIGYHLHVDKIISFFQHYRRSIAIGSIAFMILFFDLNLPLVIGWFYGNQTFVQLGVNSETGMLYRLCMYMLQCVASIGFLALVPIGAHYITELGRRTLYVFLLHGLLVRAIETTGILHRFNTPLEIVILLVFAILVVVLLAQPQVKHWTSRLVEPSIPQPLYSMIHYIQRHTLFQKQS